jgi:uncharacterized coiled-coil DUF342 family protein
VNISEKRQLDILNEKFDELNANVSEVCTVIAEVLERFDEALNTIRDSMGRIDRLDQRVVNLVEQLNDSLFDSGKEDWSASLEPDDNEADIE